MIREQDAKKSLQFDFFIILLKAEVNATPTGPFGVGPGDIPAPAENPLGGDRFGGGL